MNQVVRPMLYPFCQKVLPLVYDDALSYYESLCKIIDKINEIIEAYSTTEEKLQDLVDKAISEFKIYVDEENQKQDKNANIEYEKIYHEISALETKIIDNFNVVIDIINNNNTALQLWVLQEIKDLKKYIDDVIAGKIKEYNPWQGITSTLSMIINDIYTHMRYGALTAYEYDRLNLSAESYQDYGLNAVTYDCNAKYILRAAVLGAFNTYGLFNSLYCTLGCILDRTKPNSLSAKGYDDLLLSAEDYDNKAITAQNYDFNSMNVLEV